MFEPSTILVIALASFVLIAAAATTLVIKAWFDGSLKHDLKWVRLYVRIYLDSAKKRTITTI